MKCIRGLAPGTPDAKKPQACISPDWLVARDCTEAILYPGLEDLWRLAALAGGG